VPLTSSGAISLNEMHVEAGGSSATQASINDADIRGLIGKNSAAQMAFNEWYGASAVDGAAFTGNTVTWTHAYFQTTYTAKGYCGSGSRGSNGYFNFSISGGGSAQDRVITVNGTSRFLTAIIAYNEVNAKLSLNTYKIDMWLATRYSGTGYSTTSLPAGVTGFNIYGDTPQGGSHVWSEFAGKALKINGTQYAVFPSPFVSGQTPGNGIIIRNGGAQNPSQGQIDVETLDNYHSHSISIDGGTHSSTGSTTIGSNILNEFTGAFTVEIV
tara:strand:+ start:7101 stop:7910 length:810 start_codon:yes stop_codon:yes gene_type:complete